MLIEVAAIKNSYPLTDVLNDVTSLAPLNSVNLYTMKSKVVLPAAGHFTSENTGVEKSPTSLQQILEPMEEGNATNTAAAKGDFCSVKIRAGAADKSDNLIHYLERPVNKLVVTECASVHSHPLPPSPFLLGGLNLQPNFKKGGGP